MNCILIDDEPLALKLLAEYINETEELTLLKSFSNPVESIPFLDKNEVELIFLDVQMPQLSGMQFLELFGFKYKFILTTAYEKYAVESFEHQVLDYLLKPISKARFDKAVARLKISKVNSISDAKDEKNSADHMFVKTEYKTIRINLADILYVESLSDYVSIHMKHDKILSLDSLKRYESLLPNSQFIRVHKSYIVSLDKIDFIERNDIHIHSKIIPIGKTFRDRFWARINKI